MPLEGESRAQIVIEIDPEEQARFLAELRRARRDRWLAIHILLLLALHRSPSERAAALLCARSTVDAVARGCPPALAAAASPLCTVVSAHLLSPRPPPRALLWRSAR